MTEAILDAIEADEEPDELRIPVVDRLSYMVQEHSEIESPEGLRGDIEYPGEGETIEDYFPLQPETKDEFEFPPFPLVEDPNLIDRVEEFVNSVDTEYLEYATNLAEVKMSESLYRRNPNLPEELLENYSFKTLMLYEEAKSELSNTFKDIENLREEYKEKRKGLGGLLGKTADKIGVSKYEDRLEELESKKNHLTEFIKEIEEKIDG